jgi:hypothetical protein
MSDEKDKAADAEQEPAETQEEPYEVVYPEPDAVPEVGETGDADDGLKDSEKE